MIYLRWTGLGWLSLLLTIVIFFASLVGAGTFIRINNIPATILIGTGLMVLLAPLHWLLGLALNSKRTPSGRQWHDRHTFFDMPVQYGFGPQLVFALITGSIALGQLTSPFCGWLLFGGVSVGALAGYALLDKNRHLGPVSIWVVFYALMALVIVAVAVGQAAGALYGWLLFGGILMGVLIGYITINSRRQLRSVADRKEFAAERGWLYKDRCSDLGKRWKGLFGKRFADAIGPFGVLAGEVEGLPFTAFDSQPGGRRRAEHIGSSTCRLPTRASLWTRRGKASPTTFPLCLCLR